MSNLIIANNISKTFSNRSVVKPTSLTFKKGKIYVIEGKTGSGKSTLLSMLGGLEKPTSGKIRFKNESFYDLDDNEQSSIRGNSIGFIFQSFHLIPELNVKENIELPLNFSKEIKNKWDTVELAKLLEIYNLLNKKPEYLSGGEQQRVAIARALINKPDIIFADEPTGNLDGKTTKRIVNLLTSLNEDLNITLIIVTHEKNLIKKDHILLTMEDGYISMEDTND